MGCVPALRLALYSEGAPLRVVAHAIETLAAGCIPAAILTLGAVLYRREGSSPCLRRAWPVNTSLRQGGRLR